MKALGKPPALNLSGRWPEGSQWSRTENRPQAQGLCRGCATRCCARKDPVESLAGALASCPGCSVLAAPVPADFHPTAHPSPAKTDFSSFCRCCLVPERLNRGGDTLEKLHMLLQ